MNREDLTAVWTPDDFRRFKLELAKHADVVRWVEPLAPVIDIKTRERIA